MRILLYSCAMMEAMVPNVESLCEWVRPSRTCWNCASSCSKWVRSCSTCVISSSGMYFSFCVSMVIGIDAMGSWHKFGDHNVYNRYN